MRKLHWICILSLIAAIVLAAGENYNSIYLGDLSVDGSGPITVQIKSDGTVIAYKGRPVPGMHDPQGRQVYIRKVDLR